MIIGLAAKLSKLEWDMYRLKQSEEQVVESYQRQEKDINKIVQSHWRQKESIEAICQQLGNPIMVDLIALQEGRVKKPAVDALIAVGGDNFFQICSHYFPSALLVGVNADPQTSHGALLNFTYETLRPLLPWIRSGDVEYEECTKVSTTLNGKETPDATCTVSLAIKATDMMSRYLLKLGNKTEEQKATGFLVVSGAGSGKGSWYRNAGLYLPMLNHKQQKTAEFAKTTRCLRTLTREPMGGEDCQYQWLNLFLGGTEELEVMYWANEPSELSIDSIERLVVKEGDRLLFRVSEKPLKVVKVMA